MRRHRNERRPGRRNDHGLGLDRRERQRDGLDIRRVPRSVGDLADWKRERDRDRVGGLERHGLGEWRERSAAGTDRDRHQRDRHRDDLTRGCSDLVDVGAFLGHGWNGHGRGLAEHHVLERLVDLRVRREQHSRRAGGRRDLDRQRSELRLSRGSGVQRIPELDGGGEQQGHVRRLDRWRALGSDRRRRGWVRHACHQRLAYLGLVHGEQRELWHDHGGRQSHRLHRA